MNPLEPRKHEAGLVAAAFAACPDLIRPVLKEIATKDAFSERRVDLYYQLLLHVRMAVSEYGLDSHWIDYVDDHINDNMPDVKAGEDVT